jgi:hypothetical protein
MNKPKQGSRWTGHGSHEVFRVLNTIDMKDGHTWVHYCKESDGEQNYSCYLESFLERFTETVN